MNKIIKALILAVVIGISVAGNFSLAQNGSGQASVIRDDKGIWFIKSNSIYNAFEAMGYCIAEDRLWQLELYRRSGRGTLAELFGESQLPTDIFVRTMSYSEEELTSGFNNLDTRSKTIIQAYVDGINRRITEIQQNPVLLPFEFQSMGGLVPENWKPTDILAWSVLLQRNFDSEAMSTGQIDNAILLQELQAKFPDEFYQMFNDLRWINDPDSPTMIPYKSSVGYQTCKAYLHCFPIINKQAKSIRARIRDFKKRLKEINAYVKMGSYAWVVSGAKTTSGNPILYSGPQMGFSVPSIVAEGSVDAPGYNVSGITVPGIPGIIIGRTPHHAWSMQVGQAHTVDYYLEDPSSVILNRIETIKVAGGNDVTLPVYRTRHGPVIHPMPYNEQDPGDTVFSWKYSHWGYEFSMVQVLSGLGSSNTLTDFIKSVKKLGVSQHFCYADRAGTIAYCMSGRDPVRPEGVDTRFPQLGDGSQEWPEPVSLKPRSFDCNTKQGFYGGWNNKSRKDYDNNNLLDIFQYGLFQRAHAVQDYLSINKKFSYNELRSLALNISATDCPGDFDNGGNTWKFVSNVFTRAIILNPSPERLKALLLLNNYDGHFISGGPSKWANKKIRDDAWVLQNSWIYEVIKLTFEDELSQTTTWQKNHPIMLFNVLLHALAGHSSGVVNQYDWFKDSSGSGKPTTLEGIIVMALDNVLAELGPRPWNIPRGEIVFAHDLIGEVNKTPFSNRSTYAQCVEIGPRGPVRIETMFPLGESGNILVDEDGNPVFDANYFSMHEDFNNFVHRKFPLFKEKE